MNSSAISRLKTHVQNEPAKIIVSDYSRTWTWSELLSRSHDYALVLQNNKIKNKIIPIIADRTGETIAAILGCLISGNGFAPLSGNQPKTRIEKCLHALETSCLIVTNRQDFTSLFDNIHLIHPDPIGSSLSWESINDFSPHSTIYNLFTSGSTGTPKGVLVSAANIENTMLWSQDFLDWNKHDVIGCASNFFFDISMFDFFSMIYFNIPLAIFSEPSNTEVVLTEIKKFKISSIFSVPLFFSQLSRLGLSQNKETLHSLRRIISGGDFFPPTHILNWMNELNNVHVYNVWGPTETSIVNTMHLITEKDRSILQEGKSPSVGESHERMPLVLVDESRKNIITKSFQTGEIAMLGDCVTQGYLKDTELTKKIYGSINNRPAFFTQDLGFVNDSGQVFILGRMGSTVKISGYRVELGEVETAATNYENVYLASAFVKSISEEVQELWIVLELKSKSEPFDIFSFKNYLRKQLPHYMVPKRIFIQDNLPKNENGKIDRNKVKQTNYQ